MIEKRPPKKPIADNNKLSPQEEMREMIRADIEEQRELVEKLKSKMN
ncbi:hypothetical protein [Bradyrhizobium guangdongense]|uniref:Uncharacterized protein n=1 Tax=Bradyrhizobium guangdongense TaxID=1325090 RepID=A0AA87W944_9BRAD|nr:hypothetical protein [Bradyrhizobium guangdongense]GGI25022.1 hypothetical protein GCM10010987_32310 [Bradyrhizobium guangdongense]